MQIAPEIGMRWPDWTVPAHWGRTTTNWPLPPHIWRVTCLAYSYQRPCRLWPRLRQRA